MGILISIFRRGHRKKAVMGARTPTTSRSSVSAVDTVTVSVARGQPVPATTHSCVPNYSTEKTVLRALGESGQGMAKQEEVPTVTGKNDDQRSGPNDTGGARSAFRPLGGSFFVPLSSLQRDLHAKWAEDRSSRKLQTSCMSSCPQRNAITSSYSSTRGFLPVKRRRDPAIPEGLLQKSAKTGREEGPPSPSAAPVVYQRKSQPDKNAEATRGQKGPWRNGSRTPDSPRPRKRRILLLLLRLGEPLWPQTSCMSSCPQRNAIKSSYISTRGFLPVRRRRDPAIPQGLPQKSAKTGREEGPPSPSAAPVVYQRKSQPEKNAEAARGQKRPWRNGSRTSDSPRPRKRRFPLLLHRRGEPLMLPPAPEPGFRVTAEDLDSEKEAAFRSINSALRGETYAIRDLGSSPQHRQTKASAFASAPGPPASGGPAQASSGGGSSTNSTVGTHASTQLGFGSRAAALDDLSCMSLQVLETFPPEIQVFMKDSSGQGKPYAIDPDDSIHDLKEKVEEAGGPYMEGPGARNCGNQ
ncbi:nuclear envelope pore membrane protein POM 121-like [Tursiops truncatus]|uniref:nuclear envelope pore membrane protein POM 121-like n=1 Tax=Tursiops truncatus TaxID=9739 RepID=UPI003CCF4606